MCQIFTESKIDGPTRIVVYIYLPLRRRIENLYTVTITWMDPLVKEKFSMSLKVFYMFYV